ncbi:MAG: hypothetical protein GY915_09345 [bacterium]|nr:hypothetical protein [bacterium]
MKKALGVLDHLNFDPKEREAYESRLAFLRMETSAIKKKYLDGLKEGKEEGLKEGEAKGIEKGKEEGLKEGEEKSKVAMAQSFLKEGVEISIISKVTGLSESEIKNLETASSLHVVEKI